MNLSAYFRLGWTILGGFAWCWFVAGCTSTVTVPPSARVTRLLVENLTDYEWRIAVAATAGAESQSALILARSSVELNLAGGDYVIEQAVVSAKAGPELSRRLPVRLEPGQTYHWRLVTLLSNPAGPSGATAGGGGAVL